MNVKHYTKRAFFVLGSLIWIAPSAASIVDAGTISGYGTFKDDSGRTRLDIGNLYAPAGNAGGTPSEMFRLVDSLGFTVAGETEINKLFGGLPLNYGGGRVAGSDSLFTNYALTHTSI